MFEIRTSDFEGVQLLLEWATAEGWNPGLDDATPFYAADSRGFLLGYEDGKPVAGISVVASGDQFGFLGLYIVHPDYRGRGFGWRTWQAGTAQLGQRTIGLDGVVAQQSNYARSGFKHAHRSLRFSGKVNVVPKTSDDARAISSKDLARLIAFDAAHYGAPRPLFLQAWLDSSSDRRAFLVERNGSVVGYGVIRPSIIGYKVGPLFADTPETADALLGSMLQYAIDAPVMIDIPEPNVEACRLAKHYGLAPAFETARMYRGPAPTLPLKNIFGLTSFELG